MLRDADRREELRIVRQNFRRRVAVVKFAEQSGDGLHDERIGIAGKKTFSIAELRNEPQFGETAGNQIFGHAQFQRERRHFFGAFDEERETVLSVFQCGQLRSKFNLFFREVHGAEIFSINAGGRCFGFRRACRFLVRWDTFVWLVAWRARLVAAWSMFLVGAMRFVVARSARRRLVARRLDAAERSAQLFNLALIGEFLALGDFDEFQNFVELINRVLERLGDFRGVRHGLADGRGFCRAKISGLDPRLRTLRFGPVFRASFPRGFGCRRNFRGGCNGGFGDKLRRRFGNFFR